MMINKNLYNTIYPKPKTPLRNLLKTRYQVIMANAFTTFHLQHAIFTFHTTNFFTFGTKATANDF